MLWRWHLLSLLFVITHKLCTFVPKSDVCTYFNANLADFGETEVSLSCFFALPVGKEVSVGGCSPLRYAPRGCTPQRNILIPLFKICTSILNLGLYVATFANDSCCEFNLRTTANYKPLNLNYDEKNFNDIDDFYDIGNECECSGYDRKED